MIPKVDEIKKPYSPKTIRDIHGTVISPMLGWIATRKAWIDVNPCAGVQLPPLKFQAVSLDEVPVGAEIPLWMRFGYDVSVLAGDLITLAVGTGLRYSELTALRTRDIDLDAKTLRVAQAVKLDKNHRPYIANYGKTDSALRTIRIGDDLCRLRRRRKENLAPDDLIFQSTTGGILQAHNFHQVHWTKVVDKAREASITTAATMHKFRHSHATMLLAANVSIDTVCKRLGHKSIVITSLLYSHLVPEADTHAADVISAVMNPTRATAS